MHTSTQELDLIELRGANMQSVQTRVTIFQASFWQRMQKHPPSPVEVKYRIILTTQTASRPYIGLGIANRGLSYYSAKKNLIRSKQPWTIKIYIFFNGRKMPAHLVPIHPLCAHTYRSKHSYMKAGMDT